MQVFSVSKESEQYNPMILVSTIMPTTSLPLLHSVLCHSLQPLHQNEFFLVLYNTLKSSVSIISLPIPDQITWLFLHYKIYYKLYRMPSIIWQCTLSQKHYMALSTYFSIILYRINSNICLTHIMDYIQFNRLI